MQPVRYRVARYEIRADDRGRRFYVYVDSEDRP
jgi:hypothetical protein